MREHIKRLFNRTTVFSAAATVALGVALLAGTAFASGHASGMGGMSHGAGGADHQMVHAQSAPAAFTLAASGSNQTGTEHAVGQCQMEEAHAADMSHGDMSHDDMNHGSIGETGQPISFLSTEASPGGAHADSGSAHEAGGHADHEHAAGDHEGQSHEGHTHGR